MSAAGEAEARPATAPEPHILIVDDAPIFREISTVFLRRLGTVSTAGDGTTALELVRRERPDLVVSDLCMREMDGDELCRILREDAELKHTPIVLVTSGRSAEEHERAVRAGADDVIEKPIKRLSLLQAVSRFLREGLRGQPRVGLQTEVVLSTERDSCRGRTLNVSRGGIFVESEKVWEPDTVLRLELCTPDGEHHFLPTARVAWRRTHDSSVTPGMGLQFLKLDRDTIEWLEEYVYELSMVAGEVPAPA